MASRFAELATDEESEDDMAKERKLTLPEKAVYLESDALQIEMGNIVMAFRHGRDRALRGGPNQSTQGPLFRTCHGGSFYRGTGGRTQTKTSVASERGDWCSEQVVSNCAFRSHETDILTEEICMGWFEK